MLLETAEQVVGRILRLESCALRRFRHVSRLPCLSLENMDGQIPLSGRDEGWNGSPDTREVRYHLTVSPGVNLHRTLSTAGYQATDISGTLPEAIRVRLVEEGLLGD